MERLKEKFSSTLGNPRPAIPDTLDELFRRCLPPPATCPLAFSGAAAFPPQLLLRQTLPLGPALPRPGSPGWRRRGGRPCGSQWASPSRPKTRVFPQLLPQGQRGASCNACCFWKGHSAQAWLQRAPPPSSQLAALLPPSLGGPCPNLLLPLSRFRVLAIGGKSSYSQKEDVLSR